MQEIRASYLLSNETLSCTTNRPETKRQSHEKNAFFSQENLWLGMEEFYNIDSFGAMQLPIILCSDWHYVSDITIYAFRHA